MHHSFFEILLKNKCKHMQNANVAAIKLFETDAGYILNSPTGELRTNFLFKKYYDLINKKLFF
jgi:hypothetical protein